MFTGVNNSYELVKYFHCPNNCGRKYKHKKNVSRHLTLECGVPKKFKCSICERYFTRNDSRLTHMLLQHGLCK